MGRKSALTDKQWEEIGKKLLAGEKAASLAREYGVSKGLISQRFSKRTDTIKSVANQIVATDHAISLLNISERLEAFNLADELKAISGHLIGAARYGAANAHRLMGMAHTKTAEIDGVDPLSEESVVALKGISALTRLANDSCEIPMGLLKANKDSIDSINDAERAKSKRIDTDIPADISDAARTYQDFISGK
jgi:hypothetical protein